MGVMVLELHRGDVFTVLQHTRRGRMVRTAIEVDTDFTFTMEFDKDGVRMVNAHPGEYTVGRAIVQAGDTGKKLLIGDLATKVTRGQIVEVPMPRGVTVEEG